MENLNKKNAILGGLVIIALATIGGIYYFNQNSNNNNIQENQKQEAQILEFGDISKFVKKDLTAKQKEELKAILEQRKDRQVMIKEILDEAYAGKGDMEEAWIKVQEMREKCKKRILPFIADEQKNNFLNYCDSVAQEVDSNYVQK